MAGATGITVTAGTAAAFVDDGLDVKNGLHVVDATSTDFITRKHATFKNRPATPQADGSYSKGKRDINLTTPIVHPTNGKTLFPVFRGTFEIPPEMTAAQRLELRLLACQLIMDSETDDFYDFGSTK